MQSSLEIGYHIQEAPFNVEFWASAYVHNRWSVQLITSKHIIGLEHFRDILQICPNSRKLSDVNVNKLHQPWRSFAAVINKCLCGTPSYDSLRLSQAQILWGMYNKKNIDYAYLRGEASFSRIRTKPSKDRVKKLIAHKLVGSGADERNWCLTRGSVAPEYDSEDDISWKSSDDDQDDEQDQDDDDAEKHDVHETTQEEEEEDDHDDDENDQEDDET
ncbi:hypothetical protein Tco_1522950 [Tanacetum coccineum]